MEMGVRLWGHPGVVVSNSHGESSSGVGLQSNIVNFSISPQTVEPMNFTISCLDTPTVVNNYLPNAQSSMSSSLEWKIKPVWSDLDAQVLVFFQVRVTLLIDTGAPPLNLDNRITYTITPQLGLTNT